MPNQLYEKYDETGGADLGMSANILHSAPLSGRMYKIRTLLSTDIVDNVGCPAQGAGRKALLHAARGRFLQQLGRSEEAREAYGTALKTATLEPERRFLAARIAAI